MAERKNISRCGRADNPSAIQKGQELVDRSVRDEISRNRQEHSTQSQALRSEVVTALTGLGDSACTRPTKNRSLVFALTEREREVPVLLADGMSTQEAAARLGIG
jgi:DNA-binding NarL/FixJ family response regulator